MPDIVHCIASRGRPAMLADALRATLGSSTLDSTKVVVALDEDDKWLSENLRAIDAEGRRQTKWIVNPRQDSIGQLYNLCVESTPGDLYTNGCDDIHILTRGWDAKLAAAFNDLPNGIGVVGFGQMPCASPLPAFMACSRKMIDVMGYFLQPWTPYWWHDTWLWEIAQYAGVFHQVEIEVGYPVQDFKTQGLREVGFWQSFFDETRPMRREIAMRISPELAPRMALLGPRFFGHGALLRDSQFVAKNFPDPETQADERYQRIRANAEGLLNRLRLGREDAA